MSVAVWSSSTTQPSRIPRMPSYPARRAASRRRIGRSSFPPAPAMYSPIFWISGTGESMAWAISSSIARRSSPTSAATRSFRMVSSVGDGASGRLLRDRAVLDVDLGPRRDRLDLRHRELLADLGHAGDADLLVELPEQFTRDGVHDGSLVATDAHDRARPEAVLPGEIDHDPA